MAGAMLSRMFLRHWARPSSIPAQLQVEDGHVGVHLAVARVSLQNVPANPCSILLMATGQVGLHQTALGFDGGGIDL